jgi:anti-sigma B factor antagonist
MRPGWSKGAEPNGPGRIPGAQMSETFGIEELRRDGTVIVKLRGELDMASADVVTARLEALRAAGMAAVLDLDDLVFMDSSGLRVVLQAVELRHAGGWDFSVTAGSGQVRELFASAGIVERLPIVPRP